MPINKTPMRTLLCLAAMALVATPAHAAPKKQPEPEPLTATGEKLQSEYAAMLESLRSKISGSVPEVSDAEKEVFLKAHADEGPQFTKVKPGSKQKPQQKRDTGIYKDFPRQKATLAKARPLLRQLDGFLGGDALDPVLVKAALVSHATPRGLAEYAQQSAVHKARIDALLADPDLMEQMLVAGGAMMGRYGQAMEILQSIHTAGKQPQEGILDRLALATALELAAREMSDYRSIDPLKRYLAYEKWYLAGELDPHFKDMTTWECRYIINDYETEEMLAWLRTMVNNYRPDTVDTEYVRDKYMAINGEIPQTTPQYDEDITRLQSVVCNGGRCGPKATLGRATTRAFGIPTWGARVKAHTGMTYWTPHGWTTALGVAVTGSFWDKDNYNMWSTFFRLDQMARENPAEYLKALRCEWIGDILGQERVQGMKSGTGGFWHALALNQRRAIASDAWPDCDAKQVPWALDTFALTKDFKRPAEENSPLVSVTRSEEDLRIVAGDTGTITIPAAACVSPTQSTGKILFMKSRLGGLQLHYKRKGSPENFVYEVDAPAAGDYQLSAKVVTLGRDQSLQFTLNNSGTMTDLPLPYTIGEWCESKPVTVSLVKGKNTLSFTRRVPEEYGKHVWTRSGPEYGGVSIRAFTLQKIAR